MWKVSVNRMMPKKISALNDEQRRHLEKMTRMLDVKRETPINRLGASRPR
jgi:hypothetical protein